MRSAFEKSDMPVDNLPVVEVADPVKGVGDRFGVVIPIAEIKRIGLNVAINLRIKFDSPREWSPSLHSLFSEKSELFFEVGVIRRVETSAEAGGAFEGNGDDGRVETNRRQFQCLCQKVKLRQDD